MINVIDEFTRECLAIEVEVDHSIDTDQVIPVRERLAVERGCTTDYVRFDNGPVFITYAVEDWCRLAGTEIVFIDPGSPRQNAWMSPSRASSVTSS